MTRDDAGAPAIAGRRGASALLAFPNMFGPRQFLVRLLAAAITLAITAGAPAPSRAPHELRGWIDAIAEVGNRAASRAQPAAEFRRTPPARRAPSPTSFAAAVRAAVVLFTACAPCTHEWPSGASGRDVIALKRARLI
jgi:hypothetical protein